MTQLRSAFDDPRIAAVRSVLDMTAEGREVAGRLDSLPIGLRVGDLDGGAGAEYARRSNTMLLRSERLGSSDESRFLLALDVLHEGRHRIQRGSDLAELTARATNGPRAMGAGLAGMAGSLAHGGSVRAGWQEGTARFGVQREAEAYLGDHRHITQMEARLGRSLDVEGPLPLRELEQQLGRPPRERDLAPLLAEHPLYRPHVDGAARAARTSAMLLGATTATGAVAVVGGRSVGDL